MRRLIVIFVLVAITGCKPKYSGTGSIVVDKTAFTPAACHVLGRRGTGISLERDPALRIDVSLGKPEILDYGKELSGKADVQIAGAGAQTRNLGACAELRMKGEGYHEPSGRAASGHVTFACGNDVTGSLDFSGCF